MIRYAKPNPLLNPINHTLLQTRFFAFGTPKGKSKLKTTQALKRHNKTSSGGNFFDTSFSKGKKNPTNNKPHDNQLINAACPVRYLRPKQIKKESQREKLGLISKEKQKELDIQKKLAPHVTTTTTEPVKIQTHGLDYVKLGIFTEEELPKYRVTVEDGRRLAKEYSRVLMKEHRRRRVAEVNVVKMRKAALEALPEELRVLALEKDLSGFPTERGTARVLPPVEGYLDRIMDAAKKNSGREKLR